MAHQVGWLFLAYSWFVKNYNLQRQVRLSAGCRLPIFCQSPPTLCQGLSAFRTVKTSIGGVRAVSLTLNFSPASAALPNSVKALLQKHFSRANFALVAQFCALPPLRAAGERPSAGRRQDVVGTGMKSVSSPDH